jgi:hypothetical protein
MSVLVTGGAGYIGSHMVHALVDAGERVVVLDNLATGFDWAIAKGTPLVIGDVGDRPCVAALIAEHRVDAVSSRGQCSWAASSAVSRARHVLDLNHCSPCDRSRSFGPSGTGRLMFWRPFASLAIPLAYFLTDRCWFQGRYSRAAERNSTVRPAESVARCCPSVSLAFPRALCCSIAFRVLRRRSCCLR